MHAHRRMAAVVALQSGVRGMQGRKLAAEQQVLRAKAAREEFFSRCAGLVQRYWRGYRSRKHVHDFYGRRRWLDQVLKVNAGSLPSLTPRRRRLARSA